ncbi:hypothetical protein IWW36_000412 [Coemansia brasiliensis]|uniref:F-box domain-containing protein n=1 Tax=Coemansia brasiliensis TaxID=2650707 RepID=A0A9W8IIQ9_9FUNG|nr:hypothetical protein IWW36_000412 [Coemansia brasiliensis]
MASQLAAGKPRPQHKQPFVQSKSPWLLCDPTDLPSITSTFDNCSFAGGTKPPSLTVLVPSREWHLGGNFAEQMGLESIPQQLLTPPMSPIEDAFADSIPETHSHKHSLHTLPPHILLSIVSHLQSPDITALSQTCSIFRIYLAPTSPVWSQMCRLALNYTPKYLSRQQTAEYYLRVRGNRRLEDQVLVHRERIEKVIYSIVHLPS